MWALRVSSTDLLAQIDHAIIYEGGDVEVPRGQDENCIRLILLVVSSYWVFRPCGKNHDQKCDSFKALFKEKKVSKYYIKDVNITVSK